MTHQLSLFDRPLPSPSQVRQYRDNGMRRALGHAERDCEGFTDRARKFVVEYLRQHGDTPGEVITEACVNAGIRGGDLRAFGAVYHTLAKRGMIEKAGECKRMRGHGTSGGNIWRLKAA